jgi:hypothetical protein
MDSKRETAVADARETRADAAGLGLNRKDRRALKSIDRKVADIDRQIAGLEKSGGDDASQE